MGWTKRQLVEKAFEEIGLAAYVFDLQPEQLRSGLDRMDSMMATWNGKGLRLGYPIPRDPSGSDLDQDSNVPDSAIEAIYKNLSIAIAPIVGKAVSAETRSCAADAYAMLLNRAAQPMEVQIPGTMPAGAGNKNWNWGWGPFVSPPQSSTYPWGQ